MKTGIRKPSIKRSVKAKTTGKVKRMARKAVDPTYGKKGMGWVKKPKKAAYNAVYNRTTVSAKSLVSPKSSGTVPTHSQLSPNNIPTAPAAPIPDKVRSQWASPAMGVVSVIDIVLGLLLCLVSPIIGLIFVGLGLWFFFTHRKYKKEHPHE